MVTHCVESGARKRSEKAERKRSESGAKAERKRSESGARADIKIFGGKHQLQFGLMSDLCADVILGRRLLSRYSEVTLCYGGSDPPLRIPCETQLVLGVAAAKLKPPGIFQFLAPYCKPVAANSRRYSQEDSDFIKSEIHRVLDASVIEPANYYPWSAQVLAVNQTGGKKRLCVNHSVAINRFTYRDAYPLPRIYEIVSKIAQDAFSFSIDLNSVYHQVPRIPEERPMTAFEADGKLFQYCRLPFGVANGTFTVTSMILTVTDRCY